MQAYKRKIVYAIGFLFSIAMALVSYINSSFLETYIDEFYVSLAYIVSALLTVGLLLKLPSLLNKIGNYKASLGFMISTILAFGLLSFGKNTILVVVAFGIYFISVNFFLACLDVFIEDFSSRKATGRIRGAYLLSINLAWVVAQMLSGSVIAKSSWNGIYLLATFFTLLATIITFIFLKNFEDPKYRKISPIGTLKTFWLNKDLTRIYIANLILKFFFAWMVIYTPIYLNSYIGFEWQEIGIIFSIMLLPFVILDYPLGKISDKIGEKNVLIFGFMISGIFTFIIPFITENKIWIWALILFMTRVGAACIEVMSESYFFKNVSEKDDDEISFFRNTTAISFILGPLLAIIVLALVPSFRFMFPILSAVLCFGILVSLRLKDVR